MRTPWFMHCHHGVNTLVGAYPVFGGVYVRSYQDKMIEVTFYPQQPQARRPVDIGKAFTDEDKIDAAIEAHERTRLAAMPHAHLVDTWTTIESIVRG